jgi:thiol-disulfide isomerase/thioredoxin
MAVINATDNELRSIIFDNKRVLVKFIDKDCSLCKVLAPSIEALSVDPRYKQIVFLRIDAATNPVSAKEVQYTKAPFFAGYFDSTLVECGTLVSQAEVETMLQKLQKRG